MSFKSKVIRDDIESIYYVPPEGEWVGKLKPNYFCRAWNAKRSKYCTARAGAKTDHTGEGRCFTHGGSQQNMVLNRRYGKLKSERFQKLIEQFDGDTDPLDLLPDLALLRAIVVDYMDRHEETTNALLAWKHSFTAEYRADYMAAYEVWLATDQEEEPFLPPMPVPDKPRTVVDISQAAGILDKIGSMVFRIEKLAQADAIPRTELIMLAQEMGRVVERANSIQDPPTRLRAIKQGWHSIRLRLAEGGTLQDEKGLLSA